MSVSDEVARYYAARAAEYDRSAGYLDRVAERLREPIKARLRGFLAGHDVLEIACGTGYWTKAIASAARSVLATDVDPGMVDLARARLASLTNVSLQVADAYSLASVPGRFTAAYAHWWWSHVPKSRLRGFLEKLNGKLLPRSVVLFIDQLPYEHEDVRYDNHGNRLERRQLIDGRCFDVVKNFPTEDEIRAVLAGIADDVRYVEYPTERSWSVTYRARAAHHHGNGTAFIHEVHEERPSSVPPRPTTATARRSHHGESRRITENHGKGS